MHFYYLILLILINPAISAEDRGTFSPQDLHRRLGEVISSFEDVQAKDTKLLSVCPRSQARISKTSQLKAERLSMRKLNKILAIEPSLLNPGLKLFKEHTTPGVLDAESYHAIGAKCLNLAQEVQGIDVHAHTDRTPSRSRGIIMSPSKSVTDIAGVSLLANTWIFPKGAFRYRFMRTQSKKPDLCNLEIMMKGSSPFWNLDGGKLDISNAHHIQQRPTGSTIFVIPSSLHRTKGLHHKDHKKSFIDRSTFDRERRLMYKYHAFQTLHSFLQSYLALGLTDKSVVPTPAHVGRRLFLSEEDASASAGSSSQETCFDDAIPMGPLSDDEGAMSD